MRHRRLILWCCFLGVLAMLGVGIYHFESPEPIWTQALKRHGDENGWNLEIDMPDHFSPDGKQLFTKTVTLDDMWQRFLGAGPVWDVATGVQGAVFVDAREPLKIGAYSDDGRYVIEGFQGPGDRQQLLLIDLRTGVQQSLSLPPRSQLQQIDFSPSGDFFAVFIRRLWVLRIYETATCRLIEEIESAGPLSETPFYGDKVVHYGRATIEGGSTVWPVECWSLKTRQRIGTWRVNVNSASVSPDGSYLLAREDTPQGGVFKLWNLNAVGAPVDIPIGANVKWPVWPTWVGQSRLVLSHWQRPQGRHDLYELPSGRHIGSCEGQGGIVASPDGRRFADFVRVNPDKGAAGKLGAFPLTLTEAHSGTKVGGFEGPRLACYPIFTPDSRKLIFCPVDSVRAGVFDVEKGVPSYPIRLPRPAEWTASTRRSWITPDSRVLLFHEGYADAARPETTLHKTLKWLGIDPTVIDPQFNDFTVVFDLESNRERFCLRGWGASHPALSNDGDILATLHHGPDQHVLRCWDVNAWKPLRWPIGIPVALGASLVLLTKARDWRRRNALKNIKGEPGAQATGIVTRCTPVASCLSSEDLRNLRK